MIEKSEKESISKKLTQTTKDFGYDCTAHAIPKLLKTKSNLFRFIWINSFLISLAVCLYLSSQFIKVYLNYNTVTNYNRIVETRSDFPAITICNLNSFDMASHESISKYYTTKLKELNITLDASNFNGDFAINNLNLVSNTLKGAIEAEKNSTLKRMAGFSLNTMLISCNYNRKDCSPKDFVYKYSQQYGNCYTFNNNNSLGKTIMSGRSSGLSLELFVGEQGIQDLLTEKSGVLVNVQDSTTELNFAKSVFIHPGSATEIEISREKYYKLGPPFSNCRSKMTINYNDPDFFNINKTSIAPVYTQQLCFDLYKQVNLELSKCKCYDPLLPIPNNYPICDTQNKLLCSQNVITRGNMREYDILKKCPAECYRANFNLNTYSAVYPTRYYASILAQRTHVKEKFGIKYPLISNSKANNSNRTISLEDFRESCLKVSIYLADLTYTLIDEEPELTWSTLIANVGGLFGVFLGASLLTLLEFLEYIYSVLWIFTKHI